MKKTVLSKLMLLIFSSMAIFSLGNSQQAVDQYGFGGRTFLIQSALEVGKSTNGIWDVPGKPGSTMGNLKYNGKADWLQMGVWEREKGDPDDRLFVFRPASGSADGRYYISFARNTMWGINAIALNGRVEARTRSDHFELKHMGNGRWKIYSAPGIIVCLDGNSSKNGTKLVLRQDFNGPAAEWVFFDLGNLKSFIPASAPVKTVSNEAEGRKLEDVLSPNYIARFQYFNSVSASQFANDNAGGKMVLILNDQKIADQWKVVKDIVSQVKVNKDISAKRAILSELLKVEIKQGSNFLEKALGTKMKESIRKEAVTEKDAVSKKVILDIADKF